MFSSLGKHSSKFKPLLNGFFWSDHSLSLLNVFYLFVFQIDRHCQQTSWGEPELEVASPWRPPPISQLTFHRQLRLATWWGRRATLCQRGPACQRRHGQSGAEGVTGARGWETGAPGTTPQVWPDCVHVRKTGVTWELRGRRCTWITTAGMCSLTYSIICKQTIAWVTESCCQSP